MYKEIIALSLLSVVCIAQMTGWIDCGTPMAIIHEVRITNCTQAPCGFVRGQTYTTEIYATAAYNSNTLNFTLQAAFFGLNLTLTEGNGCNNLTLGECPVVSGNRFNFLYTLTLPTTLPQISTVMTGLVWNDAGQQGICIQIPVHILP